MADWLRRAAVFFVVCIGLSLASTARADPPSPRFLPLAVPPDAKISPDDKKRLDEVNKDIQKLTKDYSPKKVEELKQKMPFVNASAKNKDFDKKTREQISNLDNALGQHKESKELSDVTLQEDPNDRDALNNRALANYGLKDFRGAKADARRAIQIDPSDERAFTTLALTHYAEGAYLQAVEDARRALALDKNNETAFYVMKVAKGRIKPTDLHLGALDQARAEQIQREYEIASAQQNEAAASIKDAPASVPASPAQALSLGASQKLAQRNYWGAIIDADRYLEEHPNDARAHLLRANAYNLVGRCEDAFKDASAAIADASAEAFDARSLAEYCLNRYPDAAGDAGRAIALSPESAYAYLHRARARERMLDIQGALADYRKAAELNAQFEPLYKEAVASYGEPQQPPPDAGGSAASAPNAAVAARPDPRRGMPAWLWIAFAAGGLLVGLGIFGIGLSLSRRERPAGPPLAFRGLQNYRLIRPLAEGGMGVVYEAYDEALNRTVAIKRMRDEIKLDADSRERFLEEARTVAALRHPNIMEIFSILDAEDDLFLVFEYISGKLLSEILRERALTPAELRKIFHGACTALEYAHKHGVIHRDLKPANIMITDEGEPKVMDFGIAHHLRQALAGGETSPVIAGTVEYMAPEAKEGVIRPETDVYALAVSFKEALQGREASPAAAALLMDALDPNPDRRITSPLAFWKRLEALPELALSPAASAAG